MMKNFLSCLAQILYVSLFVLGLGACGNGDLTNKNCFYGFGQAARNKIKRLAQWVYKEQTFGLHTE